jgi:hypothetical protein
VDYSMEAKRAITATTWSIRAGLGGDGCGAV